MTSARWVLGVLGVVFLSVGAYVASTVDGLLGLGVLLVGAFLLILPFTAVHGD